MKLIPLSKTGKNKGKYFAKVDDEDYEYLMQWNWHIQENRNTYYAIRGEYIKNEDGSIIQKTIRMHRLLMNAQDGDIVDHKDKDGLNNQKSTNIRFCSSSENCKNKRPWGTSQYLGVHYNDESKKNPWVAQIRANGKHVYIGRFKTEENAAIAYNIYAEKYHGEFANYNTANI